MTEASVEEYKESLKTKAENLLKQEFPVKIVELNSVIKKLNFGKHPMSKIHEELNIPVPRIEPEEPRSKKRRHDHHGNHGSPNLQMINYSIHGPKVYTLPNGPAPNNKFLSELIHTVKPYIRGLVEDANTLKMWISYLIPKIEDGNNFGVSIQGRTLNEIQVVESKAEELLDNISEYFVTRAKIVSKVAKYPHIGDYRLAVKELDEKEYLSMWLALSEVRNRYCMLHDIVTKNFDKIKKPRSCNTDTLY